MKEEPLVTVVVPCYNHERYVQECLQSIIDQEYKNIELIIIDDGSKDDSVKKIEEMLPACKDRFTRCEFRARPNKGLSATLNEALEITHGKYFSPIASDDVLYPDKLTKQVALFERADERCAGIFGGVELINEFSRKIKVKRAKWKVCYFEDIFLRKIPLIAPSALLRTDKIKTTGGYNNKYLIEDYCMWFKLLKNGDFFQCVEGILVKYRRHSNNLSKSDQMWQSLVEILNEYKYHCKYNKALAAAMLVEANCIQVHSKINSLQWMHSAVKHDIYLVFSLNFYKFLIKFFL